MVRIETQNSTYLVSSDTVVCPRGSYAGLIEPIDPPSLPLIGEPLVLMYDGRMVLRSTAVASMTVVES